MDGLLSGPVTSGNAAEKKRAYDRVQEIMVEQAPILYLVYPEVLGAIGPELRGAVPVPLTPHLFWNIDRLSLQPSANGLAGRAAGAVR